MEKSLFLVKGFTEGFTLHYEGPRNRTNQGKNLPFNARNKCELWMKIMKEVTVNRYAGPFEQIPYECYV